MYGVSFTPFFLFFFNTYVNHASQISFSIRVYIELHPFYYEYVFAILRSPVDSDLQFLSL